MNVKRILTVVLMTVAALAGQAQQATTYTQYGVAPIPLNHAASFLRMNGEISVIGRQQWVGVEGAPQTYRVSGVLPVLKSGISAGFNFKHESIAVEHLTEATAFVGKAVSITEKGFLAMSLGLGASFYKGDFALDAEDPAFRDNITETDGLLSLNLLFYQPEKYYIGVSLPRLTFSKLGITNFTNQSDRKMLYHFTAGAIIPLGTDFDLKPAGLLTWAENLKPQADISAMVFLQRTAGLGINVRTYGDLAGMAQFHIKKLSFGYSYQFSPGNQPLNRGIGNNTHEISMNYRFGKGVINLL